MLNAEELQTNMAELRVLKDLLRERAMIYQCENKEYMARFYGLPLNAFYAISCDQYLELHRQYIADIDKRNGLHKETST